MKIKPLKNIVYIKLEEVIAGALVTSSRESAVEYGEVLAVGEGVTSLKKGDTVFVKAWAIDNVFHEDTRYCFVNIESGGILAIVA